MIDFRFTEAQTALVESVRRFARDRIIPVAAECDREGRFPRDVFDEAWKLGLVNPTLPPAYGGKGRSVIDSTRITEELAYGCSGIQTGITGNVVTLTAINLAGSEEQKKKYLGWLAAEPVLASYATTEAEAGSEVAAMQTRAVKDGSGGYVLNGAKAWVCNASLASFYLVFATENPALRHEGIGAFLVDRDAKGLAVGARDDKLGQRACDSGVITLEDVHVPASQVLAVPGAGFMLEMAAFDWVRPDLGASAVGLMRRCFDECVVYAKSGKVFGLPIAQHQLVQWMIAEMAIRVEATQLLVLKAAWSLDDHARSSVVSSYAKAYGADAAVKTAIDAVQIFGGNGYIKKYPVEKLLRDAKVFQLSGGGGAAGWASQIQRLMIARNALMS